MQNSIPSHTYWLFIFIVTCTFIVSQTLCIIGLSGPTCINNTFQSNKNEFNTSPRIAGLRRDDEVPYHGGLPFNDPNNPFDGEEDFKIGVLESVINPIFDALISGIGQDNKTKTVNCKGWFYTVLDVIIPGIGELNKLECIGLSYGSSVPQPIQPDNKVQEAGYIFGEIVQYLDLANSLYNGAKSIGLIEKLVEKFSVKSSAAGSFLEATGEGGQAIRIFEDDGFGRPLHTTNSGTLENVLDEAAEQGFKNCAECFGGVVRRRVAARAGGVFTSVKNFCCSCCGRTPNDGIANEVDETIDLETPQESPQESPPESPPFDSFHSPASEIISEPFVPPRASAEQATSLNRLWGDFRDITVGPISRARPPNWTGRNFEAFHLSESVSRGRAAGRLYIPTSLIRDSRMEIQEAFARLWALGDAEIQHLFQFVTGQGAGRVGLKSTLSRIESVAADVYVSFETNAGYLNRLRGYANRDAPVPLNLRQISQDIPNQSIRSLAGTISPQRLPSGTNSIQLVIKSISGFYLDPVWTQGEDIVTIVDGFAGRFNMLGWAHFIGDAKGDVFFFEEVPGPD